jgi:serine/threonine protein kinase
VIAGIALAMRFAHSSGTVDRDLSPENILLDWDWTVRIADFGDSASLDAPPLVRPDAPSYWPSVDFRYFAPECYDGTFGCASNVFACGLILFEILAGRPAFPEHLNRLQIAFMVAVEDARPEIPEAVAAIPHVNSAKVAEFVKGVEDWEKQNTREINEEEGLHHNSESIVYPRDKEQQLL